MKIGIAIFTYNRSWHLQQVLKGLQKNKGIDKLYIFQDGLKRETHKVEWQKVKKDIEEISWCDKTCVYSDENKGLARSIVDGINFVLKENDAVIVLEDDCVPTANFVSFMKQCFEKYVNDKSVYSVTGYAWPINLPKDSYDIYGCGRISSWGWGTWKDRWKQYQNDNNILQRIKKDKDKSKELATWGSDLEETVIGNIKGQTDSWAVYWALFVIEKDGICINPYKSLIQNIGMDGTGVHCGITEQFQVEVSDGLLTEFLLPDKIEILDTTKVAFAGLYGSYTAVNKREMHKKKILIYGLGNFYLQNEKIINEKYYIQAFIDKDKKGWFGGKKIICTDKISNYNYENILIMVQDIQECINIIQELILLNVDTEQIILGHSLYGAYSRKIDKIGIRPDSGLLLKIGDIFLKVRSKDEFNNVCEVLLDQTYNYYVNNGKKDIVLDVGMNIGSASLYFLHQKKVEKVYGYEPFRKTYKAALENLEPFLCETDKLEIFQYEISNEPRKKTYLSTTNWGLIKQKDEEVEIIEVQKASSVFAPIIEKYPLHNIILKIDCEGEEYRILEELLLNGLLSKITFIMLKWHYKGKEPILKCLKKAGFSWWCNDKNDDMGLIYAYKTVYE